MIQTTVVKCSVLLPIPNKCMYYKIIVDGFFRVICHCVFSLYRPKTKNIVLSDSDDNFKPIKKAPQPTRKHIYVYLIYNYTAYIIYVYFTFTASSEELFDSLVGNSSPEKQQKPLISSSGEDSPIKFTLPKKGN